MGDDGRTVHVVDDDEAIRQSVGFMLRKAGYRVEAYAAGMTFLKTVTRETPGCVLLDVRMPDLDGLEVQARLSGQGISLPVIMLTGHGDVTLAVRAIKAGAIEFLEKPFERLALIGAIDLALDRADRIERRQLASADAAVRLAALTARERDVLDGMVRGRPNKLIAFELQIATRTVEVHRAHLMESCRPEACPTCCASPSPPGWTRPPRRPDHPSASAYRRRWRNLRSSPVIRS